MPYLWGVEYHLWADGIAFAFALAASILCAIQIHHHIYHNHHPETRKYIIRILLMVVVYCIESWCGLYLPSLSLYLDTVRDSYEALVIYSFYQLLICALGGYENVQHALYCIPMRNFPHFFPFNYCCDPWSFSDNRHEFRSFLRNTTIGVLQYCFVQPVCVAGTFIMQICGVYHEGSFNFNAGYPYIAFIRSASQTYAIYCLVLFYLALKKQPMESEGYQLFAQIRPIPKFLCIKGVVFFTYWQSIMIAFLVYFQVIKSTESWTSTNIATALQDLVICVEMLAASIAHIYAFKVDDFKESGYTPLVAPHKVLFDVANVTDLMSDAREVLTKPSSSVVAEHDEYYYEEEFSDDETDNNLSNNSNHSHSHSHSQSSDKNITIHCNNSNKNNKNNNNNSDDSSDSSNTDDDDDDDDDDNQRMFQSDSSVNNRYSRSKRSKKHKHKHKNKNKNNKNSDSNGNGNNKNNKQSNNKSNGNGSHTDPNPRRIKKRKRKRINAKNRNPYSIPTALENRLSDDAAL